MTGSSGPTYQIVMRLLPPLMYTKFKDGSTTSLTFIHPLACLFLSQTLNVPLCLAAFAQVSAPENIPPQKTRACDVKYLRHLLEMIAGGKVCSTLP